MTTSAQGSRSPMGRDGAPVVPKAKPTAYYDRPVLKAPVWTWEVPTYFFVGGMAGAAAPLAAAARFAGNDVLARRAALLSFAGLAVSPPLLISDLGRPERFYRMLRVIKPTSAMSLGTWILSTFGAVNTAATAYQVVGFPPARLGVPAVAAAAVTGPLVSTYTAVLIAQTSVPVWHEARVSLPWVFAGSSLASAGGLSATLTPREHSGAARALAVGGAALELAAETAMTRSLDPRVRESYEAPGVKPAHLAARACILGGAILTARGSRLGGLALAAGSALTRLAVIRAGRASAADPVQTVAPQRERVDRSAPAG